MRTAEARTLMTDYGNERLSTEELLALPITARERYLAVAAEAVAIEYATNPELDLYKADDGIYLHDEPE